MESGSLAGRTAGRFSNLALDPQKLRWLLWLRWRLFLRNLTRNRQSVITFAISVLFLTTFCGSTAVGFTIAYRLIAAPGNAELLYIVLSVIALIWILLPVFQYGQNEGLDVSKLLHFPLTRGEMMVSLLVSQLIDVLSFGLVLWLMAVVVGFTLSPGLLLLTVVAMLIFLALVVSCSQLVMALLSGLLQNRRFRDVSYIAVVLFFALFYLAQQLILGGMFSETFTRGLMLRQYSPYLGWLPPGWIAHAIEAGLSGNWLASLGWLLLALLLTLVLLYLWQRVLERTLTQPEVGGQRRRQRAPQMPTPAVSSPTPTQTATIVEAAAAQVQTAAPWFARFISPQTLAIALKDLRYFRRDPQLLSQLIMPLVFACVVLIVPFLREGTRSVSQASWLFLFYPPFIVFLYLCILSINSLGLERKPLTLLFLYPIKPERIFFGKNLAALVPSLVLLLAMLLYQGIMLNLWHLLLPFSVAGLAGIAIVLGWGNLTSVFFPFPVSQRRGMLVATSSSSSGAGCMRGILQLLILVLTLIVLAPVILAMLVPFWLNMTWLWVGTAPASLAYGLAFYQLLTRLVAAPALLRRGPEILEMVVRD
jgi:ABC-2 type transport system permease protein